MSNEIKDSGKRESFGTGAVRDTADGKGFFDCLPFEALRRLAVHMENGAKKYGKHNWRKGINQSRYLQSALRHLNQFAEGHRDEDHLAAVMFNVAGIIEVEKAVERGVVTDRSLLDLPNWVTPAEPAHKPKTHFAMPKDVPRLPDGYAYTGQYRAPDPTDYGWINGSAETRREVSEYHISRPAIAAENNTLLPTMPRLIVEKIPTGHSKPDTVFVLGENDDRFRTPRGLLTMEEAEEVIGQFPPPCFAPDGYYFTGEFRCPAKREPFLCDVYSESRRLRAAIRCPRAIDCSVNFGLTRYILKPLPDGIQEKVPAGFRLTGEYRVPKRGESWLADITIDYTSWTGVVAGGSNNSYSPGEPRFIVVPTPDSGK